MYAKDQYQEALEIMNAINNEDIKSHPNLKIEKARILMSMKKNEEALTILDDLNYESLKCNQEGLRKA